MLVAKDSFAGKHRGVPFVIKKGQTIDENHPIVREYTEMFGPVTPDIRMVEEATAVPGQARNVLPPKVKVSEDLSLEVLRSIARQEGLKDYGAKSELVSRINRKRGF
jgi:hypothetical protein